MDIWERERQEEVGPQVLLDGSGHGVGDGAARPDSACAFTCRRPGRGEDCGKVSGNLPEYKRVRISGSVCELGLAREGTGC